LIQNSNAYEPDFNWTWTHDGSPLESRTPFGAADYWDSNQPGDKISMKDEDYAGIDWKTTTGLADYTFSSVDFPCSMLCTIPCKKVIKYVVLLIGIFKLICAMELRACTIFPLPLVL
jgi:hypothetical protein